jgi:hypothetical protein
MNEGGIVNTIVTHPVFPWIVVALFIGLAILIKMTMHPDNKDYKHKGD